MIRKSGSRFSEKIISTKYGRRAKVPEALEEFGNP